MQERQAAKGVPMPEFKAKLPDLPAEKVRELADRFQDRVQLVEEGAEAELTRNPYEDAITQCKLTGWSVAGNSWETVDAAVHGQHFEEGAKAQRAHMIAQEYRKVPSVEALASMLNRARCANNIGAGAMLLREELLK
jgi:hypothetical protein